MYKKVIMVVSALLVGVAAQAQIGYKGQFALAVSAGIDNTAALMGSASIGGFISAHSMLGVAGQYNRTKYNCGDGDTFNVAQWMGEIRYQYAISTGKLVILPTGGLMLGVEVADPITRQGNMIRYGSNFAYGIAFEANVEYVFSRHWVVFASPRLSVAINSKFDKLRIAASAGVKYYF